MTDNQEHAKLKHDEVGEGDQPPSLSKYSFLKKQLFRLNRQRNKKLSLSANSAM